MFQAYYKVFYSLLVEGEFITIDDPSLSAHGYQLLSLATSQLVGNIREFDFAGIFSPVLLIVSWGELTTIEDWWSTPS